MKSTTITTISISHDLLARAKKEAGPRGLSRLVSTLLTSHLTHNDHTKKNNGVLRRIKRVTKRS